MGVLIINETLRRLIRAAVARARQRPVPWEAVAAGAVMDDKPTLTLAERVPGFKRPPSEFLTLGTYEAAFSFEYQPAGLLRHLSVACTKRGRVPTEIVVKRIAEEFGFVGAVGRVWLEEFEPGHFAVNVVELVEENPTLRTQQ